MMTLDNFWGGLGTGAAGLLEAERRCAAMWAVTGFIIWAVNAAGLRGRRDVTGLRSTTTGPVSLGSSEQLLNALVGVCGQRAEAGERLVARCEELVGGAAGEEFG